MTLKRNGSGKHWYIYREDDVEDKLVATPNGIRFSKEEIQAVVNFQEQYFKCTVEVL